MTVSGRFAIVAGSGVTAVAPAELRVEKPNKTNDSANGRRREDERDPRSGLRDRRRSLSRNETTQNAPFWNGPRLRAPFVAQIIGQMTGGNAPDAQSALACYAQIEQPARRFDRSI
jgi:hypothetical protein